MQLPSRACLLGGTATAFCRDGQLERPAGDLNCEGNRSVSAAPRRRAFDVKLSPLGLPVPCLSLTLQDGGWVKEDEETEVNRGTSKPRPWFRCLLSLVILPSPCSQSRFATGSWCHQRTMLKLRACASAVPEFERSQLASLSCELLG